MMRTFKQTISSSAFILALFFGVFHSSAQTGTSGSPYTALGQAQNVTTNGVYYFNLTGTTFSTYVLTGGWVQLAFDFGNGVGNLPQVTSLTNTARGILNPTVLSKLGSATIVRITSNESSFAITSSNATHVNRILNNQCLHTGTADNGLQGSWSGSTSSLGSGCNSNSNNGLHQRIYHAACNGNGFHWVPKDNNQSLNLSIGELAPSSYLQLWVQAPMVAVINGPVISTQPSASAQNLCLNSSSAALSVAATGTATITYQWYSNASPSNSGGTLISGATTSSYSPPTTVAGTKYYYVVATNPQGSTTSAVSGAITTSAPSVAGSVSANQTICAGGTPANITITGSTGSIQWQSSTDNITFTNISGATSATLPLALISNFTTRFYRAIVTNSPCSAVTSSVVTVTVIAQATAPTSITGSSSICLGASVTLTAVGGTGSSYQWGTGNTPGTNTISGQTGATLTVSPTANTTYWVRRTQTSPCSGNTGGVTFSVSVSTAPTATASASNTTVCPGGNTTLNVTATQVIAAQNFDNVTTLSYSLSGGSIGTGTSGGSGVPTNAPYGLGNSNAYVANNSTRTITFDNIANLGAYTNKKIEFNVAALSSNSSNGLDAADNVRCSISTDGGATYSNEIQINGNDQNTWSYTSGTGVAEVTYDGNNTALNIAPSAGGVSTTEGFSTVRVNIPDAISQIQIKIRMDNNSSNEIWAIDNIRVTGIPTFTYSWATVAAPSTVLASTQSSIQTPTTNTTYVATVTNAAGCSTTSQVAVAMTNPTLASAPSSGNVIWRGATSTDWNTASNWYNFDGTNYTVASAVPTDVIDVIIPANQTCVLAQPSVLSATTNAAKNVTIESGATLTLAGGTLNVAGDWTNNGIFTGSTGTVSFIGTGTATLGGTSSTTFANLSMDKSGSVALSTPVTVSASLSLNNGIIELGANTLSLGAASVSGGSATSYVKTASTGTMSRIGGATATTFPVGNSTYNPAVLTNNGTSDVFSVRVIDNVTANGTGVGVTTSLAVVNRTWMISEATTGGSNASVRLYWNGAGEEVNGFSAASAYVAHYSTAGSMWENMGGSVGADYVQSTDAITNFSPFTISSTNTFAPLPVELLSFDAQCADQDVIVRWTTASEHNSLNFAVQRSEDGTAWADVQTVEAAGNSNTVLDYAIQDLGAARGVKYYRLIQTDQDGVQKIYGPIQTNCGSDVLSFLTFPNPSTEEFTILFGSTEIHGDVTLTVSDATGKVVRNAALFIEKGTASTLIPSLDLAPGVYHIQLSGDNFQSAIIKHSLR